jgi:hypothetical protein
VKCHLALNKVRDAAICAKEAVSLYPRSSDAYLALGSVYAQTPSATGEVSSVPMIVPGFSCCVAFQFLVRWCDGFFRAVLGCGRKLHCLTVWVAPVQCAPIIHSHSAVAAVFFIIVVSYCISHSPFTVPERLR